MERHGEHSQISHMTKCTGNQSIGSKIRLALPENLDDPSIGRYDQVVCLDSQIILGNIPINQMNGCTIKKHPEFHSDISAFVGVIEQPGNPFWEDNRELLDLDQSIFNVRKVKDGFQRYTALHSTDSSRKLLSLLQCTKLI